MMKDDRGRAQLPGAYDDFDALHKRLAPLIAKTDDGKGEKLRIVVDLPREWALLATWLSARRRRRREGNHDPVPNFTGGRTCNTPHDAGACGPGAERVFP